MGTYGGEVWFSLAARVLGRQIIILNEKVGKDLRDGHMRVPPTKKIETILCIKVTGACVHACVHVCMGA